MRKRQYIKQNREKFKQYMDPSVLKAFSKDYKEKAELAICIPTYERADVVNELIRDYILLYKSKGYDLYIYDSSSDTKTELVVRKWANEYDNLYYVKMPTELHSNMKVYKIFQLYGLEKKYKYIWVCSDSIRWTDYVWNQLDDLMEQNYDMILVNYRDQEPIGSKEYTDKLMFFRDCAWHLTLYGATLINTDRMLQNVDWDRLQRIYNISDRVNHSHVAFYFEKIYSMDNFKAYHWSIPNKCLIASGLKTYSGWRKDTFYVWCYCFPNMIDALPDFYNKEKSTVILKNGKYSDILNIRNLITMRAEDLYTMSDFWDYFFEWERLTDVPKKTLVKIARNKYQDITFDEQIKLMNQFCNEYSYIYIYGAGKFARRYLKYLHEMGIAISGFIVTDIGNNPRTIEGYPVYQINEVSINDDIGIILGLGKANQAEVLEYLKSKNTDGKHIFAEYIMDVPYVLDDLKKYKKERFQKNLKLLKNFCKQSGHIYLYGTGQCSYRYSFYLKKMGMNIDAYIVSQKSKGINSFNGHSIVECKEMEYKENDGIVLAVNPMNNVSIRNYLSEQQVVCRVFDKYIISNDTMNDKEVISQNYFNEQQTQLVEFCKNYNEIYLYGAGKCGLRYLRYLRLNNINVCGFIVSSREAYWHTLENIPIYELGEIDIKSPDFGIVIAMNKNNTREVLHKIDKNSCNIFSEYIIPYKEDAEIVKMRYYRMQMDKMLQFIKRYPDVYIYGAGQCARRYIYYLNSFGVCISGVIVTNKSNNPKYIGIIPVYSFDEVDENNKKLGIILGLNKNNMQDVKKIIEEKGEIEGVFDIYIQPL